MSDFNRQIETTALIEVTRSSAAQQAALAGLSAKLDSVRELLVDHKSSNQRQIDRLDVQIGTLTVEQRKIDRKVDDWQSEAIRRIDEAIVLAKDTQAALKDLNPSVARWRKWDATIVSWGLLVFALVWILTTFWPAIHPLLKAIN